jgi:hypothetical protein
VPIEVFQSAVKCLHCGYVIVTTCYEDDGDIDVSKKRCPDCDCAWIVEDEDYEIGT